MLISTRTHYLDNAFSIKDAIKIIAEVGFDAYDITFLNLIMNQDWCFNKENYVESAKELRKFADSLGIVCNQSHAPFPASTGDPLRDAEIYEKIIRSIELSSILGAKFVVVHPIAHPNYYEQCANLFEINVQFLRSLIPYAKKHNIKIAIENVFGCIGSNPEEMCRLIDTVGSQHLVACLDVGHAAISDIDVPKFIKTLGNSRIKCVHIHDNDLINDLHDLPFTQKIDYNKVISAFSEIDYDGDFTYEACGFFRKFPVECWYDALKFMHKIGKNISAKITKNK